MRRYATVSGVFFALLATAQLARLLFRWPVQVASVSVPLQQTRARSCGGIAVEWLDVAHTCVLVSRLASRSPAVELGRWPPSHGHARDR